MLTTLIEYYHSMGWNDTQIITALTVKRIMGSISILGSGFVIQDVLLDKRKHILPYYRLMFGLSISDVLSSLFMHVLSTSPMPKGYHMQAVGYVTTCDAVGFINTIVSMVSPLYNCFLATFYFVQIVSRWKDREIETLEKWLHIGGWSFGLLVAVIGLALKLYGPIGFTCWASPGYPLECTSPDSSVKCIRGLPDALVYIYVCYHLFLALVMCFISYTMFQVFKCVRTSEIWEKKCHIGNYMKFASGRKKRNNKILYEMTIRVMTQGVLYCGIFFIVYLFLFLNLVNILFFGGKDKIFVLDILQYIFWPLQGFFNAFVYIRNLKQNVKKRKEKQQSQLLNGSQNSLMLRIIESDWYMIDWSSLLTKVKKTLSFKRSSSVPTSESSGNVSSKIEYYDSQQDDDSLEDFPGAEETKEEIKPRTEVKFPLSSLLKRQQKEGNRLSSVNKSQNRVSFAPDEIEFEKKKKIKTSIGGGKCKKDIECIVADSGSDDVVDDGLEFLPGTGKHNGEDENDDGLEFLPGTGKYNGEDENDDGLEFLPGTSKYNGEDDYDDDYDDEYDDYYDDDYDDDYMCLSRNTNRKVPT